MSVLNEERILNIFDELNVKLLTLNPNIVKSWFDTDDKNLKDILNWICLSLSKKNYICPLQQIEYSTLPKKLSREELEKEKNELDSKYPHIFDSEFTDLEIKFLEAELNLAKEEEKELDKSITANKDIEIMLKEKMTKVVNEKIDMSVKLNSMQEKCLATSEELDKLTKTVYDELVQASDILYKFEFEESPMFINNFDVTSNQEKFNNSVCLMKSHLESELFENENTSFLLNASTSSRLDETTANSSDFMRQRLLSCRKKYLKSIIELEKLKYIIHGLDNIVIETLLVSDESLLNEDIKLRLETANMLWNMLQTASEKIVNVQMNKSQIKTYQKKLEIYEGNLQKLIEMEIIIQELSSHYALLKTLFDLEKKDFETYEILFKNIGNYICENVESSIERRSKMKDIIEQYKNNSSQEKQVFINSIISLLSSRDDLNLKQTFKLMLSLKDGVSYIESKLFDPGFEEVFNKGKELRNSAKALQSFLISGPTNRILVVPSDLQIIMRQVDEQLQKERDSIASTIKTTSLKVSNKWDNYRRQLWMFFYTDPNRLEAILQEMKKEYESTPENGF